MKRIWRLWRSARIHGEIADEIAFHIDRRIDENLRAGMSPEEARRDALRRFGPVQQIKEQAYDVRGAGWLDAAAADLRYAVRLLLKDRAVTFVSVITLAFGLGVGTAVFSVVYGIALRPLPYTDPDQIVVVRQERSHADFSEMSFSVAEIDDYRAYATTLARLVEYSTDQMVLEDRNGRERVQTGVVSHDFFDLFGVAPVIGRSFAGSDEQPAAQPVVLLSNEYWRRRQQADPDILGSTLRLNDRLFEVIGVLPPLPQYPDENDVYMTTTSSAFRMWPERIANRGRRFASAFARLRPGVTLQQASADLALVSGRLQRQYPATYLPEWGYRASATRLSDELTRPARPMLTALAAAAAFVLLIACANVANMTFARLSHRAQELTMRLALGASEGRLFRQLLTENLLRSALAAGLAILVAASARGLLVAFVARLTPRAREIAIDGAVLAFAALAAMLTSVATCGIAMLSMRRRRIASALKGGPVQTTAGVRERRLRDGLIVAQVAFSLALLVGASLLLRSFVNLQRVNPGVVPESVLTLHLDFSTSVYPTPTDQRPAAHRILAAVAALPGVTHAAVSSSFPLDPDAIAYGNRGWWNRFQIDGDAVRAGGTLPYTALRLVSIDYFTTLGIRLVEGRLFTAADREGTPAAIVVNSAFARHRLAARDPLGARISSDGGRSWLTIVGVVADTKELGLGRPPDDEVYLPLDQLAPSPSGEWVRSLIVRTNGAPMAIAARVRNAIDGAAPSTAISYVMSLEDARDESLASPRVMTTLLALFAVLALLVALSGIGGILALSVAERAKEIGVRLALGARPSQVVAMVVRHGMLLAGGGVACGLAIAPAAMAPLRALLFGVAPNDPPTIAAACLLIATASLVACYIPASRVTTIEPAIALRSER